MTTPTFHLAYSQSTSRMSMVTSGQCHVYIYYTGTWNALLPIQMQTRRHNNTNPLRLDGVWSRLIWVILRLPTISLQDANTGLNVTTQNYGIGSGL